MTTEHRRAMQIASQFHGGQSSGLYSLASTGTVSDRALREIARDLEAFEDPVAVRELRWLREYVWEWLQREDRERANGG